MFQIKVQKFNYIKNYLQNMNLWNSYLFSLGGNGISLQESFIYNSFVDRNFFLTPFYINQSSQDFSHLMNDSQTKFKKQVIESSERCYLFPQRLMEENNGCQIISQNNSKKNSKKTRNIKANILKDFIRNLKKDSTQVLMAKSAIKIDYSIKQFLQIVQKKLPIQSRYIRSKQMKQLCRGKEDLKFAKLLRIVLKKFLKGNYINMILCRKKNRYEYLKACRELQKIIFHQQCKQDE